MNARHDIAVETPQADAQAPRERMSIVIIGHVDHGKSTLVGRLLADTNSLPEGKLAAVEAQCRRNSKPFEYAFLLDALKDEQSQGITIDSARCFFKSPRRDYVIIDAPGHVEFLKNMISGAARADSALLLIDADEGVQENSRRHGFLTSLLGIRQVGVCVNKMDLVNYSQARFDAVVAEYSSFLARVGITPLAYVPLSAREGANVASSSDLLKWHSGPTVLQLLDSFDKEPPALDKPLRMPVQDVYKFTAAGDQRRIIAGRLATGSVTVGDEVVFLPSGKRSRVAGIEAFNADPPTTAAVGESAGITLTTQVYVRPGELMARADQGQPRVSTRLEATIFWLAPSPMVKGRRYKMKLAGTRTAVWLTAIDSVTNASTLEGSSLALQVERHDVARVTLETLRPVACDVAAELPQTGRFVIIDNYEIAGGGIVTAAADATNTLARKHVIEREKSWDRSRLTPPVRASRYNQRATLLMLTGGGDDRLQDLARIIEERLFQAGKLAYYLGISNSLLGDSETKGASQRDEYLRRVGEIAHLFTDAGLILVTAAGDLDDFDLDVIQTLNSPNDMLVVTVGEGRLTRWQADLRLDEPLDLDEALAKVQRLLLSRNYLPEYYI